MTVHTAFEKVDEDDSSEPALKPLAVALSVQAQILELTGEYGLAAVTCGRAIKLWKGLTTKHPESVLYADGLATSQIDMANVLRAAGGDPLDDYTDAVATFESLVEMRPGIPRYRFNLASALSGLAWTQNRLVDTEAAQTSAVRATNTLLFLRERFPEDVRFRVTVKCRV